MKCYFNNYYRAFPSYWRCLSSKINSSELCRGIRTLLIIIVGKKKNPIIFYILLNDSRRLFFFFSISIFNRQKSNNIYRPLLKGDFFFFSFRPLSVNSISGLFQLLIYFQNKIILYTANL